MSAFHFFTKFLQVYQMPLSLPVTR
jgi:hypothetical protein